MHSQAKTSKKIMKFIFALFHFSRQAHKCFYMYYHWFALSFSLPVYIYIYIMHTGTFCIDYNARITLANTNYITSKKRNFFFNILYY